MFFPLFMAYPIFGMSAFRRFHCILNFLAKALVVVLLIDRRKSVLIAEIFIGIDNY